MMLVVVIENNGGQDLIADGGSDEGSDVEQDHGGSVGYDSNEDDVLPRVHVNSAG